MIEMTSVLIVWGNWGPYHYARFEALRKLGSERGIRVDGVELFSSSGHYAWVSPEKTEGVHHLDHGKNESAFRPWLLIRDVVPLIFSLHPDVVFVPSYWHWSLFINFVARLRGARIVMMNESHGGTEKPAIRLRSFIKKQIVSAFHAALVGGSPHRRHFTKLGIPENRIFTGYDAVDNRAFMSAAKKVRADAGKNRSQFGLPNRYFLNLGRFVEKKNLEVLVRAFARLKPAADGKHHDLVLVGSGETESKLRALCAELSLNVVDHHPNGKISDTRENEHPTVHFYGFQQIDTTPVFYALATAFVLPSIREEWGLVVNEAMACGLPVVVSNVAGSIEDLVVSNDNGFQFDPNDEDALVEILQSLIDDPALAERMGARSSEHMANWGCDRFAESALKAAQVALNP